LQGLLDLLGDKMKTQHPKIGIVSGVGPLAGADIFARLLRQAATEYDAVEDSEYPETILISRGIDGVDNTGALRPLFEASIVSTVKQLERNRATNNFEYSGINSYHNCDL
jgi:hypothetical protein